MILRHPLSFLIISFISSFLFLPIHALTSPLPNSHPHPQTRASTDLICRPFGTCEPCPSDELDQPFCMPYGNRRLLHCRHPNQSSHPGTRAEGVKGGEGIGEIPAWEACGKVVRIERQDYVEFITCNLLFLIVALTILWARSSALASQQYRLLAARIGIPGGGWRT